MSPPSQARDLAPIAARPGTRNTEGGFWSDNRAGSQVGWGHAPNGTRRPTWSSFPAGRGPEIMGRPARPPAVPKPTTIPLRSVCVILLLLGGCLDDSTSPPISVPTSPPIQPRFAVRSTAIDDAHWGAEPSIAAGPRDELYVCAPTGVLGAVTDPLGSNTGYRSSHLWTSTDQGMTWTWLDHNLASGLPVHGRGAAPGGGDCDVAVGSDGTVYLVDLTGADTSLAISHDGGKTWAWTTPFAGLPGDDRPWITAVGSQDVYIAYHQVASGIWVLHSNDSGMTFPDQWLAIRNQGDRECACPSSRVAVSGDLRELAVAWSDPSSTARIGLSVSWDGGSTWSARETQLNALSTSPMVSLGMDSSGALLLAWEQEGRIKLGRSADGREWSAIANVTDPGHSALPWVTVGKNVTAVSYANSTAAGWEIHLAVTSSPIEAQTRFIDEVASPEPALSGPLARPLADFFENTLTSDGRVSVAWTKAVSGRDPEMWFAIQATWPRTPFLGR